MQDLATKEQLELKRPAFKKAFWRSQVVSLTATSVDFVISIFLNEIIQLYYVTSTIIGAVFGAITSFTLGRNWAFLNRHGKVRKQAFRFLIITSFSIFANTTGVFFFKESFNISFIVSKVIVAIFIGVFFNFFMNRYFVFR